jgi:glycosyltransferase involved in cell wall biosynthesis
MPKPWPVLLMSQDLDIGGCQRDLTKLALGIDRDRFEPHVGCFRFSGVRIEELRQNGIPIVHFPVYSFRSPQAWNGARLMGRYIREHGIELIHTFDVPTTVFGAPVARWYRTPAFVSSQLSFRDLYSGFFQRLLRVSDRLSDRIVVNCQAVGRDLERRGIPHGRLYLCYNGVDTSIFYPGRDARPKALADAYLVVGVAAGLRPEKGLDLLIRAFAALAPGDRNIKLLILGDGPLRDDLGRLAADLGVRNHVIFQPGAPNVEEWLRATDIFVLPSHSESFSNALLEAMACGCCVIGSRVGGTPELITEGETGLLFEPGDADELTRKLRLAMDDTPLRMRLAAAAGSYTHKALSLERFVQRLEALYTELMAAGRLRRSSAA